MLFFVASKLLAFLIKPHVWVLICFLVGFIYLFRGKTNPIKLRIAKRWLLAAGIITFITGNHAIVNELYIIWEEKLTKERLHSSDDFPRTAVILGGYSHYDVVNDIFRTTESGDRLLVGMQGLLLDKFDRIILTGGSSAVFNKVYYEAEEARKYLQQFGIDSSKIIIDNDSRNTYENAVITKRILDSLKITEPVLLVTSATHMYRARKCYEKANVKFRTYTAHKVSTPLRNYNLEAWVIPNPGSMHRLHTLLHEWVGIIMYKITGKI